MGNGDVFLFNYCTRVIINSMGYTHNKSFCTKSFNFSVKSLQLA